MRCGITLPTGKRVINTRNEKMKVGIIDYGSGNLLSVKNAIEFLGFDVEIFNNPELTSSFDKLILPGVGAFGTCFSNLNKSNFIRPINQDVLVNKKQILGICVGMQVMAENGYEGGGYKGLSWFKSKVVKLSPELSELKVPNIGWHKLDYDKKNPLFRDLPDLVNVYFVHSYHMECSISNDVIATCNYGQKITAAVNKDNIFGTQFHPEKSQDIGLKILENFILL